MDALFNLVHSGLIKPEKVASIFVSMRDSSRIPPPKDDIAKDKLVFRLSFLEKLAWLQCAVGIPLKGGMQRSECHALMAYAKALKLCDSDYVSAESRGIALDIAQYWSHVSSQQSDPSQFPVPFHRGFAFFVPHYRTANMMPFRVDEVLSNLGYKIADCRKTSAGIGHTDEGATSSSGKTAAIDPLTVAKYRMIGQYNVSYFHPASRTAVDFDPPAKVGPRQSTVIKRHILRNGHDIKYIYISPDLWREKQQDLPAFISQVLSASTQEELDRF